MIVLFSKAKHHLDLFNVPSAAQLGAGNYRKGHRRFAGLDVTIENPRGSIRRGMDPKGQPWETSMSHDYGYIKGSLGVDGDHFDCYLGPHEDASHAYLVTTKAPPAFKVDDEQKAMLGFHHEDQARDAFLAHYDNPKFLGRLDAVPMERFRREVRTTRKTPRMLKALLYLGDPQEFMKAHVTGYVRKDGTAVAPHEDVRPARGAWYGDGRHVQAIMEHVGRKEFKHYGLRIMSPHYETGNDPDVGIGDVLEHSHRWNDGAPTKRQLKGTSTLSIRNAATAESAIKLAGSYDGRQVALVGSDEARPGADVQERLLTAPKVVAVWDRRKVGIRATGSDHTD